MPALDEEFIRQLRATFKVEAEDHLQNMSKLLVDLEKAIPPESSAAMIETIYREAHSLKGAARSVDMSDIESVCQTLESVLYVCKRDQRSPSPEAFDVFHQVLDLIRNLLAAPGARFEDVAVRRDQLIARLANLLSPTPPPAADSVPLPAISPAPRSPAPPTSFLRQPAEPEQGLNGGTVRISVAKLDSHLLHTEGLLTVKAMMTQRVTDLREASVQFERWKSEWAKMAAEVASFRKSNDQGAISDAKGHAATIHSTLNTFLAWHHDYAESFENKLLALTAQATQDRHAVARRVDDLLEDSKKLLMLPFSSVSDVLPKLVRDLCRDQGKEATLVINGADVEIDKRILEEMKDPLIHILRNCVDHGVEKPAERSRLQKPPRATINIAISPVNGSKVEIEICDDGAGVNLDRVKQSAVRQGILTEAEASTLDDDGALALIFRSEVTTSPMVTSVSGRGLGMAIVRSQAERLGGKVSVVSQVNKGTTFKILLPLTLATFRGVFVDIEGYMAVVPAANVDRVLRIKIEDIHTAENREVISYQGETLSLVRLTAVLSLPVKPVTHTGRPKSASVMVLSAGGQRVAFLVTDVLHEAEVLVKTLGKPLIRIRNIAGATVLGSGKVVPVLNVADLVKSARHHGSPNGQAAPELISSPSSKKVLVAEDSITSRMLLKGVLESAGYQVKTAVDGVDALTLLREGSFDLVVSDVEMPRMNGFDLTARIRLDKRLMELPVVLVTALESGIERERGIDVGASAYIMKSTFDRNNLLDVIRGLA